MLKTFFTTLANHITINDTTDKERAVMGDRRLGVEDTCTCVHGITITVYISGEHSSELRPDTLLASDGCGGLGPGLLTVTIPVFFSIFQWK